MGGVAVFVNVAVMLGMGDSGAFVGTKVGVNVDVAVRGAGDGSRFVVAVDAASGTNSTNEIDNAPIINPTEISATTIAFLKPSTPFINCLPGSFVVFQASPLLKLAIKH